MVRQGDSDLMAYYDEVERKLTLVTNKIVMSHNTDTAAILNKEVRDDALHAFIAGLKRTLKTLVLPAQPKDLPSALALAREAENSIERSAFAASYAKAIEEKSHFNESNRRNNKGQGKQWRGEDKNPHFIPKQNQSKPHEDNPWPKHRDPESLDHNKVQPMEGAADFVNNEIKELLQNGIIRPSRSPYNSPAWVVDKKGTDDNGSKKKRLVIDFRKLNERTIADRYPMPSIPMILANLEKAQFFTTLDLKSGCHQIYLAEKDREKTSFSVNGGKYEFCRLPFGLKNAGSIFQRAIDDVLREEIGKICYVYVDDVIIFSENETEHVKHIDKVLERLLDANMRVAREKTKFFKESVEFLGLTIISIILLSTASAKITDFSHAKYIPVLDGNVLVWEQYGLVRHSTNLSEFASIIDSTVRMLELFPHSHMRKLLEVDIKHAQNLLEELKVHHRMARSLDFLGSILKVVAGTPDADDLSRINTNQASLIEANNRQASHDTCARQLHAGGAATCRTRPSNLEPLTIVDDGVIIVNEKLTRITIDDGPTTTIVGTHLITFERKAVINDSVYLNLNYSVNKSPGIAASPLINITGHDHILILPMLQRMNEHNLRLMQELREDVSAGGSPRIWFAAGVAVSLTLCALVLLQQHCRRKREAAQLQKSIDELAVTEDGVQFKGGVVNNQLPA
ncbi:hypothetical protein KR074_002916 [Drosophila pseudoananassae]|nr:hypothetical protein KR074_002916 [Drosophila pseudoananassae]